MYPELPDRLVFLSIPHRDDQRKVLVIHPGVLEVIHCLHQDLANIGIFDVPKQ